MSYCVGILSAKNKLFHPNKRLLEAGRALGLEVHLIHPKDLILTSSQGCLWKGKALSVDGVLVRIGSTINPYAMAVLKGLEGLGIDVISPSKAIALAMHKYLSIQMLLTNGINCPRTFYVSNIRNLRKAVEILGGLPVVLKAPSGRQGETVSLLKDMAELKDIEKAYDMRFNGLIVQEFVQPTEKEDIRCLVVGERVIGGVRLVPRKGEFRANYHLGAKAYAKDITREIKEIAIKSKEVLGLQIAGVDMIATKDCCYVIEVNYSPGFRGFEKVTKIDVATEMMAYVRDKLRK